MFGIKHWYKKSKKNAKWPKSGIFQSIFHLWKIIWDFCNFSIHKKTAKNTQAKILEKNFLMMRALMTIKIQTYKG